MKLTLEQLANLVSGELIGEKSKEVTNASGLLEADQNCVSFLGNMKYIEAAKNTKAGVIFISKDTNEKDFAGKNVIKVANMQYAYAMVLEIIDKERRNAVKPGISEKACVFASAKIGKNVYIGQFATIDENAQIGDGTKIFPNVYIGVNVKIGKDCIIYPNVVVRENAVIGDRVILQPNVVIGGDGFGFAAINGENKKIPQIGNVEIGNDVEIGANTTVDRATTDSTRIGGGTKIDNLVQIAHNVQIGQNCLIVAQCGISGSTKIGNNTIIGGQTGLAGHIEIGNNVLIASQSGISGSVKDGQKVGGNPMAELSQSIKIRATLRKLPQMYQDIKNIKKTLGDDSGKTNDNI
ncbi:MAG: UDP-3-O-(3-hydroxymyristoyl)glucosamine N-acyltransferase [Elusimicrobiota bacterium]|jgi:UDP-3-O-[3-hydroxymyristoyl] glucosamine N-acyltransferase|nr:UDP-3-O-(3-hydroxymyristoyl)glucosamine N-acyltransferase [Elusimicrobiota bacterium]